jgi:uncharacterized membrane protein
MPLPERRMRLIAAAAIGISAGLRSQTPSGVLAVADRRGARSLLAATCTVAEFGADLLPGAPDRTAPFPLIGRAIAGFRAGRALGDPDNRLPAALIGSVAAVAGAFGGLSLRRAAARRFGAVRAALFEDVVAVALAVAAVRIAPR